MRVTRETLIKIARDTAAQRARVSRRIVCIYLTGSVLGDEPLLGGTTDIDLIVIHDSDPDQPREVVRLTDEVHLDIGHYPQSVFSQPRHLRSDPWFGPFIYKKPLVLYETHHWFDFIQASTGAQVFQPDYIYQRANSLAQKARQSWMDLEFNPGDAHPQRLSRYFEAIENAGNSLVCLTEEGEPLTERRFLLNLPHRLQTFGQPELISDLVALILPDASQSPAASQLEANWSQWPAGWKDAYQAASSQAGIPERLSACRKLYYEKAAEALWEESPSAAVWLLLRTWTLAAQFLPADSPGFRAWESACQFLGLNEPGFPGHLQALDHYLDRVEETLETWANANGISSLAES